MYKIKPAKNDIIGYKKVYDLDHKVYIVTLLIPKDTLFGMNTLGAWLPEGCTSTKVSSITHNYTQDDIYYGRFKCRSELAYVLDISGGVEEVDHVNPPSVSYCGTITTYTIEEVVTPTGFSMELHECESGIHWFPEKWMAKLW